MLGKEIVDICASHNLCGQCELDEIREITCEKIMHEMDNGAPSTIYDILKQEYGGSE